MFAFFDSLRDVTFLSVTVRLVFAFLLGGIIGLEREYKRRPAGFRTHILICIGATMTTLTGQYLFLTEGYYTDMARLGAQVIAGIGFIGAGTILVTRRNQIKGLTTAAGLWTCAIIGLAVGAGFYEAAILTTAIVLVSEIFFARIEYWFMARRPEMNIYLEFRSRSVLEQLFSELREKNVKVRGLEITRTTEGDEVKSSAIFTLRFQRHVNTERVMDDIRNTDGITLAQEI